MDDTPSDEDADHHNWQRDRTTFQRVYDVVTGLETYHTAAEVADRAVCSENGARQGLEQLAEMGIAQRQAGRPARYRRNASYFTWKRIENLAREHSSTDLRDRLDELIAEDDTYQDRFDVPDPDAVATADIPVEDHDALHEHWAALQEWRTVRRDIRVLQQAIQRANTRIDDGARA